MGKQGRFGKYGEVKRFKRLRQSKKNSLLVKKPSHGSSAFKPSGIKKRDQALKISFRTGKHTDVPFIARLSGKAFSIFGPYEETVPEWLGYDSTVTIIAKVNERPAGFAMIGAPFGRYDLQNVVELLAIAVEPESRRKGIGELLLKEVDEKAKELNIFRIFLHTAIENLPARSLFSKAGYSPWEIKYSFYPKGQDAIVMAKEPGN
jgi:ribosomal-protein-alanine N-acetyltransferase